MPASVLPLALAALAALAPAVGAAGADAEITLRKSFRATPAEPVGEGPAAAPASTREPGEAAAGDDDGRALATSLPGVAAALGETVVTGGTLHLPDVDGRALALEAGDAPVVETASGRRLIVDVGGSIPPALASAIARRWPSYAVVTPSAHTGTRGLLSALLREGGYASVAPGTPIVFGRDASVKLLPDYVVLRREDDLLDGLTRALSVVGDGRDAIPAELREMAAAHRILVLDLLDRTGRPLEGAPWRDPRAPVTTVASANAAFVLGEIAAALGVASRPAGDAAAGTVPLTLVVGELLAEAGVPAIGPAVEFSRPAGPEGRRRFTITIPGWLAEKDGTRLLVTGADLPEPLRLFLAREGIAVFQYRVR